MASKALNIVKNLSEPTEVETKKDCIELKGKNAKTLNRLVEVKTQIKTLEKEEKSLVDNIKEVSLDLFGDRAMEGKFDSFNVTSGNNRALYTIQDKGANINEEKHQELVAKWGEEKIDQVVDVDLKSVKFDETALANHFEEIHKVLKKHLKPDILNGLFKPFHYTAKKDAMKNIKNIVETKEELIEMVKDIRLTQVLK